MTIAEIGPTIFERTVLHDAIDPHSHPILRRIIYSNHSATIFIPRGRMVKQAVFYENVEASKGAEAEEPSPKGGVTLR
jgi:hypothetical protein